MQSADFQAAACVEWHPVFSLYHAIAARGATSPLFLHRTLQTNLGPPRLPPCPSILSARRSMLDVDNIATSIARLQQRLQPSAAAAAEVLASRCYRPNSASTSTPPAAPTHQVDYLLLVSVLQNVSTARAG